jgi:hypothetical protein
MTGTCKTINHSSFHSSSSSSAGHIQMFIRRLSALASLRNESITAAGACPAKHAALRPPPVAFTRGELERIRSTLLPPPDEPLADLPPHTAKPRGDRVPRDAAVLVPLCNIAGAASLLLEVRAAAMRVHAGEARCVNSIRWVAYSADCMQAFRVASAMMCVRSAMSSKADDRRTRTWSRRHSARRARSSPSPHPTSRSSAACRQNTVWGTTRVYGP